MFVASQQLAIASAMVTMARMKPTSVSSPPRRRKNGKKPAAAGGEAAGADETQPRNAAADPTSDDELPCNFVNALPMQPDQQKDESNQQKD